MENPIQAGDPAGRSQDEINKPATRPWQRTAFRLGAGEAQPLLEAMGSVYLQAAESRLAEFKCAADEG